MTRFEAGQVLERYQARLSARAAGVLSSLEGRLDQVMMGWLLLAGLASAARIATSPVRAPLDLASVVPYVLLILAPFASMLLALRWFGKDDTLAQPLTRLAILGKWRNVSPAEAKAHPLFGTGGIMVSLLIGMLLNVPVRAAEYLAAMPALCGQVPEWLSVLHAWMTFDVVVFTSLYAIAFVAALRRVPLFPRLLVAIWLGDIAMQLFTAQAVAAAPGLPPKVAGAVHVLLEGNVKKTLISVALWLPYLLLSRRVNVTYRHRVQL